jgi:site-specific recombinase XerD
MASIKLYLDKRSKKKDGTFPLKLTVTHKKPFHIPLDVSIPKENWVDNKIEGNIKNKAFLNNYIKARYSSVENLLLTLKLQGTLDSLSPEELKKKINSLTSPDQEETTVKPKNIPGLGYLFKEHAEKFIASREAQGTKDTYTYTLDMLSRHYDMETLSFTDIDMDWLEELDTKLRPTCKVNTRSIHFRNIRAIFKNATKKKLVSKDIYPFEDFTIKTEETMHRNLSVEDLRTLRDYPVEQHQQRYRDLFMLLFYMIGINVVDLLHATGINNGRLEYRRAKTGKLYSIKIQPEAMEIINRYSPGQKHLLNFLDNYENYRDFRSRFNRNLKEIGPSEYVASCSKNGRPISKKKHSPLFPFLSSYYARHTWATLAAELDIPEKTIRMALGHGTRTVTDIYINFDMRKVDEANRRVIDYLNSK